MNGIRHTKTSPYNPSTNGLAERYVKEFKNLLRKNNGKDDLETNLQSFLFAHRASPQTVIKEFPGETANEEKFKIKILEFNTKMRNPREVFHEAVRRQEQFTTGCEVYFRNYATGPKRPPHLDGFSRFKNGMESVKDEKRVGCPILHRNPEKVNQILNLIEENPRIGLRDIEKEKGISKSLVGSIIKEDLQLK
ncbi:K02A2.6-like [Cordylochernes scorpioides]|uniref:K02A2.6-like n=1 Tax=Cordylochernes scorpioides TaxID=51811 RepID=A0ABY6LC98_9ARAC|nr:K02A2.6-like [Cordylochernes scorpioides]